MGAMWFGFVGDGPPGSTVGLSQDEPPEDDRDDTEIPAASRPDTTSPVAANRKRPGQYASKGAKASWGLSLLIHGALLIAAVLVAKFYLHDKPRSGGGGAPTQGIVLRTAAVHGLLSWNLSSLGASPDETDLSKWAPNPALAEFSLRETLHSLLPQAPAIPRANASMASEHAPVFPGDRTSKLPTTQPTLGASGGE